MEFLFADFLGKPAWLWLMFLAIVVVLLVFDLGVLHRKQREIEVGESLLLSAGYIAIAMLFGAWVWWTMGPESGINYYTAFFVEKTLALDNVFVISLIFTAFAVPRLYQHRVLLWGIIGVIVLRGIVIGLGTGLVSQAAWLLYLFAAFLVFTGVKMLFADGDHSADMTNNALIRFARRRLRVTDELHGDRFAVRLPDPAQPGHTRWHTTPLLLALIAVEFADLVFAVDSVPAVLAITTDPYIVYTSNIFAILGLRALYFALAAMVHRFAYLKYALALVLVFIGGKIFWHSAFGKVDPVISLSVTATLLASGVIVSLVATRNAPAPAVNAKEGVG